MLATHSLSLSLHLSPVPTTRPCSALSPRPALTDSTNVNSHGNAFSPAHPKRCVYLTSTARTGCGWNDAEPSGSTLALPRHHSSAPSPFPVTSKAPPTVSISLSAVCSQSSPAERLRSSSAQSLEPDLPDVRSVIPFPSTRFDGDMDVDMLDGTCGSDTFFASPRQAPRKRHSAHSSFSSSPSGLGKDAKQKRPRKSRRQVTELWWLGVVHRTILRGIEARQSFGALCAADRLPSGPSELDALDRVLVEKIQRRLADNGCVEGRALPNPLPRISSPSISVPSLNLVAPSRKMLSTGSAPLSLPSELTLDPKGCSNLVGRTATLLTPKALPSASLSINPQSPVPSSPSIPTSPSRHIRFENPKRSCQPQLHPGIPRRSPSPPARTGAIPTNGQTLTLTMPQLVASLTLAYRERGGVRLRSRTYKWTECGKNAGRSLPSGSSEGIRCRAHDSNHDQERTHSFSTLRTRLSSAPERKSPLSHVLYIES